MSEKKEGRGREQCKIGRPYLVSHVVVVPFALDVEFGGSGLEVMEGLREFIFGEDREAQVLVVE